jgi:hypothetical protein
VGWGGNGSGVRGRHPRLRLRAGEPLLGRGRACSHRLIVSAGASALLVAYGGLNVLLGALVLSGAIHPGGTVDWTALRWHVGVWDLWFLAWGIFLTLGTIGYARRAI